MKRTKIVIMVFLAVFLLTAANLTAFAANGGVASAKEEVVYANTDANGNVKDVYVVNIFNGGDITDYGDYSSVKMLNTTDQINKQGDTVTFSSEIDRVYYEGILDNAALPWDIDISYTLDGKKVTADELAGKSGKLAITVSIRQNKTCDSTFFDHYALQTEVTLDTNKCGNLAADGATIADVGKNKQLTYILMPGNEKDYTITADVTDFAMDAIAMNGLRMNMAIDIDDSALLAKVAEIENAAASIHDGATALADGANGVKEGAADVSTATSILAGSAATLASGAESLQSGLTTAKAGLDTLNEKSAGLTGGSAAVKATLKEISTALDAASLSADNLEKLVSTSSVIQQSISSLNNNLNALESQTGDNAYKAAMSQNGIDIDALQNDNSTAVTTLDNDITSLQVMIADLETKEALLDAAGYGELYDSYITTLKNMLGDMQAVHSLVSDNAAALSGTGSYISALHNSAANLSGATATLDSNYDTFHTEITALSSTLTDMISSLQQLSVAIQTLADQYDALDQGINDYTNGVASLVAGFHEAVAGAVQMTGGSRNLAQGVLALDDGTQTLSSYGESLSTGANKLASGTGTFYDEIDNMDTDVAAEIDSILSSLSGGNGKTVSFVSDKNTNVSSVQFVIKTTAIGTEGDAPATDSDQTQTQTKDDSSFLTKLLDLFK